MTPTEPGYPDLAEHVSAMSDEPLVAGDTPLSVWMLVKSRDSDGDVVWGVRSAGDPLTSRSSSAPSPASPSRSSGTSPPTGSRAHTSNGSPHSTVWRAAFSSLWGTDQRPGARGRAVSMASTGATPTQNTARLGSSGSASPPPSGAAGP